MPNYPNAANTFTQPTIPPVSLAAGESALLFSAEQPAVPQASMQVALAKGPVEGYPVAVSVEVQFSGAPGAFEIDVQDADTDGDGYYQTITGGIINAVDATNFTARLELVEIRGRFLRAVLKSRANAVNVTVKASR